MDEAYSQALDMQVSDLFHDGVTFERCSKEEAWQYLSEKNYLFRAKRYCVNYDIDTNGRYEGVDFADLIDLSSIDYQLRLFLGYIAGQIEHGIKVRFNHLLMMDTSMDGFQIAELVDKKHEYRFEPSAGFSNRHSKLHYSPYTETLIKRYLPDPEIWNLWEVFDLASLFDAYQAYLSATQKKDNATRFFGNVRRLRNAASHNSCLLINEPRRRNMHGEIPKTEYLDSCLKALFQGTVPAPVNVVIKHSQLGYDFTAILCEYILVSQSADSQQHVAQAAQQLNLRIRRNIKSYIRNSHCMNLKKLLATLCLTCEAFAKYIFDDSLIKDRGSLHYAPWNS